MIKRFLPIPRWTLVLAIGSSLVVQTAIAATSSGTEDMRIGSYNSPVWRSQDFSGTHARDFTEQRLVIQVQETRGGFDTAVERFFPGVRVDEISEQAWVSATVSASTTSAEEWWVGPKIGVNASSTIWSTDGWHENYIVESSNLSPTQWDQMLRRSGKYLGTLNQDGSDYKYYWCPKASWDQYWAIRQDYRTSGVVLIKPILKAWRSSGMSNGYVNGIRLNLETYGATAGTFVISDYRIPSDLTSASPPPPKAAEVPVPTGFMQTH